MEKQRPSATQWIIKIVMNIFGLFLCGLAIVLAVKCGLGANPWDALQVGMTNYLPITLGQASQIIAFVILVFNLTRKVIPGVGTVLNAYFIGFFIDVSMKFGIETPSAIPLQALMLLASLVLFGFGIIIALKARIGVGSRDGLMEYLINATKVSVQYIRAALEIFAVIGAIFLKGPMGIGTIIAALTLGYFIQLAAKVLNYDFDVEKHYTFKDMIDDRKRRKEQNIG
ncbi:hypothetical protein Curi_c04050 [Gottschalkia acidurici 9a]|uniref:YitT family protein n=1 Tax=Gottschalkia acidurici (strain ATCC 7906 / DSM 604 / BCRC 14475 / CIP 104303 / KCTC 5404 / NCIMB 10678 / 9a) TaxID=1128398 RepID=K0AXL5_GOTA9|nr:membrane protein [Gottschalkia acidurici]AFS77480.1 hypothetical protein Curi_c04050 [Gottschalkia acidurici 9a]